MTTPTAANHRTAATAKTQHQQPIANGRHAVVSATAVPPLGRRKLWLLLVECCALCRYSHIHRATGPIGGIRAAGCGQGSYYVRVLRAQGRAA